MGDLKPCPFCGGQMFVEEGQGGYYFVCYECATSLCIYPTQDAAIAAANRRAHDPVKERLLGVLDALPLDIIDHCCGRCPSIEKCTNPEFKPQCSIADVMELANELREAWEGETDAD